tara:strand:- start:111 stop:809 length:699 start_codon:yes stop_codon:yes gene_type:complete
MGISLALLLSIFGPNVYSLLTTTKYFSGKGDIFTIELPDKSEVTLNADTKISHASSFSDGSRSVFLEGEAYFDVKNAEAPFIVYSKDLTVRVLGTQFNVYAREDDFEIAVLEGIVEIENSSEDNLKQKFILNAGQIITFESGKNRGLPQMITNNYIPGWIHNKFIFDQDNLEHVCKEIERKFDVDIDIDNSDLGIITVTGVIDAENLSDVLATISLLTKRPYRFEEQRYIFY